ncbi:MAG: GNAT family N-acetyltransferase, partial [Henriciella sp.]|nr:GNAT family N-acetyltransferase [Henriciella sp.]
MKKSYSNEITYREPEREDGSKIWNLIKACPPLDENSIYCNVIQCDLFSDTCVVAEFNGAIVGWISALIEPQNKNTLFVWQVAVSQNFRGFGIAK